MDRPDEDSERDQYYRVFGKCYDRVKGRTKTKYVHDRQNHSDKNVTTNKLDMDKLVKVMLQR